MYIRFCSLYSSRLSSNFRSCLARPLYCPPPSSDGLSPDWNGTVPPSPSGRGLLGLPGLCGLSLIAHSPASCLFDAFPLPFSSEMGLDCLPSGAVAFLASFFGMIGKLAGVSLTRFSSGSSMSFGSGLNVYFLRGLLSCSCLRYCRCGLFGEPNSH